MSNHVFTSRCLWKLIIQTAKFESKIHLQIRNSWFGTRSILDRGDDPVRL